MNRFVKFKQAQQFLPFYFAYTFQSLCSQTEKKAFCQRTARIPLFKAAAEVSALLPSFKLEAKV